MHAPVRLPDEVLAAMLHLPECQPWCNEYTVYADQEEGVIIECACNARTWIREGGSVPNAAGIAPETDPNYDRVMINPYVYDPSLLEAIQ